MVLQCFSQIYSKTIWKSVFLGKAARGGQSPPGMAARVSMENQEKDRNIRFPKVLQYNLCFQDRKDRFSKGFSMFPAII